MAWDVDSQMRGQRECLSRGMVVTPVKLSDPELGKKEICVAGGLHGEKDRLHRGGLIL